MPDPAELISVARFLADQHIGVLTNERLRRSVSTAYYALFHKILRAGAQRFMGRGQEAKAGYAIIYRSFDHSRIKEVCGKLAATTLSRTLQEQLRRTAVSQDMRDFAAAFPAMQEKRHLADYDPMEIFEAADVLDLIAAAEIAIAAFDKTSSEEQADILALMLAKSRA